MENLALHMSVTNKRTNSMDNASMQYSSPQPITHEIVYTFGHNLSVFVQSCNVHLFFVAHAFSVDPVFHCS